MLHLSPISYALVFLEKWKTNESMDSYSYLQKGAELSSTILYIIGKMLL